jgi:hypothetical protein
MMSSPSVLSPEMQIFTNKRSYPSPSPKTFIDTPSCLRGYYLKNTVFLLIRYRVHRIYLSCYFIHFIRA